MIESEPTEEDFQEITDIINLRGYIVIASNAKYEIGETMESWTHSGRVKIVHPLVVIGITDLYDFQAQAAIWGRRRPARILKNYYRCITD